MSTEFDELADAWSERIRRARQTHRCSACGETIRAADRYSYTAIVYEGTVEQVKRCLRCERIYRHLDATRARDDWSGPYDGIDPYLRCGHTYEEVRGTEPPPEIAALAFLLPGEAMAEDPRKWDDLTFLSYVEQHSKTQRALFSEEQLARLYELAGRQLPPVPSGPVAGFARLPADVAAPLVNAARKRIDGRDVG